MAVTPRQGPKRIQRGLITFASADLQASNTVQDVQWEISEW